jgi:hypothetical protein
MHVAKCQKCELHVSNLFEESDLDQLASKIDAEVAELVHRLSSGMFAEEEDFTGSLVDVLRRVVNEATLRPRYALRLGPFSSPASFDLSAKVFDGRPMGRKGKGSEEFVTGADMMFVFHGSPTLAGSHEQKGLLAQAKKRDGRFVHTADKELMDQCDKMAMITSHSFAFVYARNGVFVFDNPRNNLEEKIAAATADYTVGELVARFVDCEVGDPSLKEIKKGPFLETARMLRADKLERAAKSAGVALLDISA